MLVDVNAFGQRENKIGGEIVNVVRDERRWRRELYWCVFFLSFFLLPSLRGGRGGRTDEVVVVGRRSLGRWWRWRIVMMRVEKSRRWGKCRRGQTMRSE